jgi:hypothetical protein
MRTPAVFGIAREHVQVKMRGVVPDHRRVEPLSTGHFPQRAGDRECGDPDLRRLFYVQVSPGVRMTTWYDQEVAELRLWLKERRHMERHDRLGLPDEPARKLNLTSDFPAHVAPAHGDHPTPTLAINRTIPAREAARCSVAHAARRREADTRVRLLLLERKHNSRVIQPKHRRAWRVAVAFAWWARQLLSRPSSMR